MTQCILAAPETATTRSIRAFADQLVDAQAANDVVLLDTAKLVEADLSFVQLVEVGRRNAAENDRTFRLKEPAGASLAALLHRAGFMTRPSPADLEFWFHGDPPR